MEEKIFYGIIDNGCNITDVQLFKLRLSNPRENEAVFCCRVMDDKCITITYSQEVGSKFQITSRHGEAIRNLVIRNQNQKIPDFANSNI